MRRTAPLVLLWLLALAALPPPLVAAQETMTVVLTAYSLRGTTYSGLPVAPGIAAGPVDQESATVRVTHYGPTGNVMADGQMPYYGAAACARRFPRGTRLIFPDGWTVECRDTGLLDQYGIGVDLFAPTLAVGRDFVARYGDTVTIEVLR
jgi:hypothetical protein